MTVFIGIDPGLSGALTTGGVLAVLDMPSLEIQRTILEKPQARPRGAEAA